MQKTNNKEESYYKENFGDRISFNPNLKGKLYHFWAFICVVVDNWGLGVLRGGSLNCPVLCRNVKLIMALYGDSTLFQVFLKHH